MAYSRRIICDIDDTISLTITRDWEQAEPIWPVIAKLNKLYEKSTYNHNADDQQDNS